MRTSILSRRRRPQIEELESRLVPTQTAVPLDIFVFHGARIEWPDALFGGGGHGLDSDIKELASTAYKAAHALNPQDRVIDVDWGSLGDPGKGGTGAAARLHQILGQEKEPHDVEVIGFSRGGQAAVKFIDAIFRETEVRRIQAVFLDPTDVKPLGDPALAPREYGSWGREHNISYHDGLHLTYSWLVRDEYALPGENRPGGYGGDAVKSHESFPDWYTAGGGQSNLVQDILAFEQANSGERGRARWAASVPGRAPQVEELYVPGGGPGLLLPVLEAAIEHAVETIVDDVGHLLQVAVGDARQIIVSAFDAPGHAVTELLDSSGNVIKTVAKGVDTLEHAVEDLAKSVWHHLPGWLRHPFGLF